MKLIEKGFLKRNKKIILISLALFLICSIASGLINYQKLGDNAGMVTKEINKISDNYTGNTNSTPNINANYLFVHNFVTDCIIIIGGLLFSIISVIVTVINAVSIGSIFGVDLTFASITVLPHGVFEYLATVLALAIALIITKIEIKAIKNRNLKDTIKESKIELKDILILFIIMTILLIIAAFIEANLIGILFKWFYGL